MTWARSSPCLSASLTIRSLRPAATAFDAKFAALPFLRFKISEPSDRFTGHVDPDCQVELVPQIAAVLYVIAGAGGVALLIREWLWLRHCRYLHDQAVLRGQNPDAAELIKAASRGRLGRSTERKQLTTGDESGKKPPKKKAGRDD